VTVIVTIFSFYVSSPYPPINTSNSALNLSDRYILCLKGVDQFYPTRYKLSAFTETLSGPQNRRQCAGPRTFIGIQNSAKASPHPAPIRT
jgi:hypothetical protein